VLESELRRLAGRIVGHLREVGQGLGLGEAARMETGSWTSLARIGGAPSTDGRLGI
jgi:hypothetical protein